MTLNVNAPDFQLPDDLQAIYDHVAGHLLRQAEPSLAVLPRGGIACAYRGANGMKCAIGALIPDALYRPDLEDASGVAVLSSLGLLDRGKHSQEWVAARANLLIALQHTHDVGHGLPPGRVVTFWEKRLAIIAERFGLRPFTRDMLSH